MQFRSRLAVAALAIAGVGLTSAPAGASATGSTTTTTTSTTTTTTTAPSGTTTTTTTTSSTTSTTLGPTSTVPSSGVPDVPTAGPPTTLPPPGSPPPAAPAPAAQSSVLNGVNADLDQLNAISEVSLARQALAQAQQTVVIAEEAQRQAQVAVGQARAQEREAEASASTSSAQLAGLAVAAYTGLADVSPAGTPTDSQTLLNVVAQHDEQEFTADRTLVRGRQQAVAAATTALAQSKANVTSAEQAVTVADQVVTSAVQGATVPGAALAATSGGNLGTVDAVAQSPTILGPSVLTAQEMANWFTSTGHTANTTVPIAQLAADYITAGQETGVRGDIAFAQSIIETGYFSFPGGGQLTAAQNNFAGIGACDSCATGWSFPNALTGVTAQEELLEAYASPEPVATPLIGRVGVGGCCQTWSALAGKWATDPGYGVSIMRVYQQMLAFATPGRLTGAGLTPGT